MTITHAHLVDFPAPAGTTTLRAVCGAPSFWRKFSRTDPRIVTIEREPLPSGHTSRRFGVGLKLADGSVVIERDSWDK